MRARMGLSAALYRLKRFNARFGVRLLTNELAIVTVRADAPEAIRYLFLADVDAAPREP